MLIGAYDPMVCPIRVVSPKSPEEWERIAQEAAVVVFARLEVFLTSA